MNHLSRLAYDISDVYSDALQQLKDLRAAGRLNAADFEILTTTTRPDDAITLLKDVMLVASNDQAKKKKPKIQGVVDALVQRLFKFESAIEMIVSSAPQVMGVNVAGLVWGSLKFVLIVSGFRAFQRYGMTLTGCETGCT